MNYFWQSIKTRSYWKYAFFSKDGIKTFFAVLGAIWLLFEMANFFKLFNSDHFSPYLFIILIAFSIVIVIISRRPISRIRYKLEGKDLNIEIRVGNLFDFKGQKVISSNSTFDTDTANGIIASNSLQGQFSNKYFPQRIGVLDTIINDQLLMHDYSDYYKISGKTRKYPIGTTVRVDLGSEIFYLLAMSDLNQDNTAQTTFENVLFSIDRLWDYVIAKGENEPIILPLIGTGRGRITTNRKRVIARIAQSFVKASEQQIFSSKLIIAIHPNDAENFNINLFEVKDLLNNYLP